MPHWFDSANELCYYGKSSTFKFSLCTTKNFISDTQTMANSSIFLSSINSNSLTGNFSKWGSPAIECCALFIFNSGPVTVRTIGPAGPILKSTIWYYIPCVPKCQRRRCPHITNQTWTIVRRKTSIVLKQNQISSIRNYQEFWRITNVCWYQPSW